MRSYVWHDANAGLLKWKHLRLSARLVKLGMNVHGEAGGNASKESGLNGIYQQLT